MPEHHASPLLPGLPRPHFLRRLAALFLLGLLACLGGCAAQQTGTRLEPGQFTAGDGSPISRAALAARARAADYILIGERHDNPTDHAAQTVFLKNATAHGIRPVLGLEMLPRSRFTPTLEQYAQGLIPLEKLSTALDWTNSWGFDFSLYSPVFIAAREQAVPVYGLNIAHDIRAAFSRKGRDELSAKEKAQLPEYVIPPPPEQREMLSAFYRQHSAMAERAKSRKKTAPAQIRADSAKAANANPAAGFERFLLTQSLWDSTMAEEAARLRARTGKPVIVLAGVGHVEHGWGIAHRLSILDPGARVLLIMPFSGEKPDSASGDIFYYSPRQPHGGYGIRIAQRRSALVAEAVVPDSPAARAGLEPGDLLLFAGAGAVPLRSPADLHRAALEARDKKQPLRLRVERKGERVDLLIP